MIEKCFFYRGENECGVLINEKKGAIRCDGLNERCAFYKTPEKYVADQDKSIEACRKNGRCENCKYVKRHCLTSAEKGRKTDE